MVNMAIRRLYIYKFKKIVSFYLDYYLPLGSLSFGPARQTKW